MFEFVVERDCASVSRTVTAVSIQCKLASLSLTAAARPCICLCSRRWVHDLLYTTLCYQMRRRRHEQMHGRPWSSWTRCRAPPDPRNHASTGATVPCGAPNARQTVMLNERARLGEAAAAAPAGRATARCGLCAPTERPSRPAERARHQGAVACLPCRTPWPAFLPRRRLYLLHHRPYARRHVSAAAPRARNQSVMARA